MQHELVLALLACPGDLVKRSPKGGLYHIDPNLPFLSSSEREAINQVCSLGYHYETLLEFVDGYDGVDGLYCRALKNGIDEQLAEYRDHVVKLEAELLSEPYQPISRLRFKLRAAHWHLTLPALARFVGSICRRGGGIVGGQMLVLLNERAAAGPDQVTRCLNRLARHCHAVLYNFCTAWSLHGRLLDPYGEFFVARGGGESLDWDRSCIGGLAQENSSGSVEEHAWQKEFVLRVDALPLSYFPTSLAQQLLHVGKAVRILRRGLPSGKGRGGFTDEEITGFEADFEALKGAPSFHLLSFEALVRRLHKTVAGRLWHLVVVEASLLDHLAAVRDLVLLGRGELWHEFTVRSRELMRHPPTMRSEAALRDGPLAAARRSCGLEADSSEQALSSRLRVGIALESFACRQFDALVGFQLAGSATHDRDARAVVFAAAAAAATSHFGGKQQNWPGSLVSVGKKDVRKNFSSLFKFSWSPVEGDDALAALHGGAVNICLVLHNDATTDCRGGHDGVSGVANALAVVLEIGGQTGACISLRRAEQRDGSPSTLAVAHLSRRPLPDTGHWLLVEVRLPKHFVGACACFLTFSLA